MSELVQAIFQLILLSAEQKPHGRERIALCESAVKMADEDREEKLGFQARQKLIFAALAGGRPELAIPAFSWCLAKYDRDPQSYNALSLIADYKWVAGRLYHFPQIERSTIELTVDDLERRYRANGESLHSLWLIRRDVAIGLGDLDRAGTCDKEYKRLPRGTLSDCLACAIDGEAEYAFDRGKFAVGLKKSDRIFADGLKCAQVPHKTHALVLLPLLRAGNAEKALEHHRAGYRMIKDNPAFTFYTGMHIALLALTGNTGRALQLVGTHMADALAGTDPFHEFHFLRYCWCALHTISETKKKAKIRMPQLNELIAGEREYVLGDLAEGLAEKGLNLAGRFDRRNGNDYYTRQWHATKKWQKHATQS